MRKKKKNSMVTKKAPPLRVLTPKEILDEKLAEKATIEKALASMNPELRKRFDKINEAFDTVASHNARRMWNIGRDIREMAADEKKYDADPLSKAYQASTFGKRSLWQKAKRFNETFTAELLEDFIRARTKISDEPLGWQYIDKLLAAPPGTHTELIEKATDNDWTPDELQTAILTMKGEDGQPATPHAGGRPHVAPVTATGKIVDANKTLSRLIDRTSEIYRDKKTGLDAMAEDIPVEKITPEALALLDQLIENTKTAKVSCDDIRIDAERCKKKWHDRLKQKAKDEAAAAADKVEDTNRPKKKVAATA